jgi:hypothetical protein
MELNPNGPINERKTHGEDSIAEATRLDGLVLETRVRARRSGEGVT